ncbi:hypothetical protein GOP47_0026834 [Adiantum capillus-veneris]|nr:hypothetical protein GOP47_0026834 [Adiantum capillus-veneris]
MDPVPEDSREGAGQSLSPPSHALLLPYSDQGHINPLMQLGIRLAAQGVQITMAVPEHVHAKLVHGQQQQMATDNNLQIVGIKHGLPPHLTMREKKEDFDFSMEEGALELVHALASQGRPVTCIVGDFFLHWTSSLAARASLPEFVFWPQCASVLSIYLNVDAIVAAGYDPFKGNVRATAPSENTGLETICIPGLPLPIHPADMPFEFPFEDGLLWIQKMLADRLSRMGESQGVICNSFEALEADALKALTLRFQSAKPHPLYGRCWPRSGSMRLVGPLVPRAAFGGESCAEEARVSLWREEVEACKEWLDLQPASSVLFVAFGSMTPITVSQVRELALGLAATGQRFLWVLREHAIRPEKMGEPGHGPGHGPPPPPPMEAMALEAVLPQGFLEQNRHVCKLVRWAPQALVLSHPAVGGFFSHCGWNSTLESICSGVPILGWPSMNDQFTNCWLATHVWKMGLTLDRNQENHASRDDVERAVRQLMEGPLSTSMRARAKELGHLARKYHSASSSIVEDMRRSQGASPHRP